MGTNPLRGVPPNCNTTLKIKPCKLFSTIYTRYLGRRKIPNPKPNPNPIDYNPNPQLNTFGGSRSARAVARVRSVFGGVSCKHKKTRPTERSAWTTPDSGVARVFGTVVLQLGLIHPRQSKRGHTTRDQNRQKPVAALRLRAGWRKLY